MLMSSYEKCRPHSRFGVDWAVRRLADSIQKWSQRARQRRRLGSLSDDMLKDIGLTRSDVSHETGKPFWMP